MEKPSGEPLPYPPFRGTGALEIPPPCSVRWGPFLFGGAKNPWRRPWSPCTAPSGKNIAERRHARVRFRGGGEPTYGDGPPHTARGNPRSGASGPRAPCPQVPDRDKNPLGKLLKTLVVLCKIKTYPIRSGGGKRGVRKRRCSWIQREPVPCRGDQRDPMRRTRNVAPRSSGV